MIMKNIFTIVVLALAFAPNVLADDRPVDFNKLPKAAQEFITAYFPDSKVVFAAVDDDIIRPDYKVVFSDGTKIEFDYSGALDKVQMRSGYVPSVIVPVQIVDYVKTHYPDSHIVEYEVGKSDYEVRLSNRLELKFNSRCHIVEVDN